MQAVNSDADFCLDMRYPVAQAAMQYWKHKFRKDGHTLSWAEAMALFRDTTGRPGRLRGNRATTGATKKIRASGGSLQRISRIISPAMNRCVMCAIAVAAFPVLGSEGNHAGRDARFFDRRVEPILRAHCVGCHNDKLKDGELSFSGGIVCSWAARAVPRSCRVTLVPAS